MSDVLQDTKLLHVIDGLGTGGAERSLAELLPGLRRAGVTPIIACLHRRVQGVQEEVIAGGFDVRFLSGSPVSKAAGLRRLITRERPDLIHTTIFAANILGRVASIGGGTPVLTSLVNTPYAPIRLEDPRISPLALSATRLIDTFTARRFNDHFHAITEAVKRWAVETMHIEPTKITVVRRGRDPARLGEPSLERRRDSRRMLGLREDDEVIVSVGRQEFQKGQRHLLEAVEGLARRRPNVRLVLAGRQGSSSPLLDRLIRNPLLAERVKVLGHRADVPDLLAAADVFAFPSLYEGLGGAVIEAMALGLPIVASDLPAVREIVEHGGNALLVRPGSPSQIVDATERLLDDLNKSTAYGNRSREIFLDRFTLEHSTAGMLRLYEQVLSTKTRGTSVGAA
jgi:glycosyltransferase involved in cell wall biosynthesis